ncbi:Putative auto-transporter adhesin, head GIN domain [Saccharicrinis carchari]|uniref:Auto-transporter adhesin, head GIN domain n=1 Tax=Saccharicrinis carchari TaxID=1168039 RepID=A0A521B2T8_SACCC|nr:DUF2807 domain-containing protein [Saccharicrinis carchari]SMO41090.1 Putative auto-transporter adhesin, head GIN domain [Saccharicrinis carchari]
MKTYGFALIIFLLGSILGCDYIDALTSEDEILFSTLPLKPFDEVVIDTSVKLILKNDSVYHARLQGLGFVLSRLNIKQVGKIIYLEADGAGFRKKQAAEVILHAPSFKILTSNWPAEIVTKDTLRLNHFSMVINGRGAFTASDITIKANSLSIAAYGSNAGTHVFRGEVETFRVISEGLTSIDARNLLAHKVNYTQRSVNPAYVFATEQLVVEMAAAGSIYLWGNPQVSVDKQLPTYEVKLGEVVKNNP